MLGITFFFQILSKDSVTVNVDAIVNFRIVDPVVSVVKVTNADRATRLLAQTTLRNILGSHKLSELLESRESIQQQLRQQLDEGTDPWGVKVETVAIKDVRIPQELQRSMAAEAEAAREAKAKVSVCAYVRACVLHCIRVLRCLLNLCLST